MQICLMIFTGPYDPPLQLVSPAEKTRLQNVSSSLILRIGIPVQSIAVIPAWLLKRVTT